MRLPIKGLGFQGLSVGIGFGIQGFRMLGVLGVRVLVWFRA